jgi:hypothetical protein
VSEQDPLEEATRAHYASLRYPPERLQALFELCDGEGDLTEAPADPPAAPGGDDPLEDGVRGLYGSRSFPRDRIVAGLEPAEAPIPLHRPRKRRRAFRFATSLLAAAAVVLIAIGLDPEEPPPSAPSAPSGSKGTKLTGWPPRPVGKTVQAKPPRYRDVSSGDLGIPGTQQDAPPPADPLRGFREAYGEPTPTPASRWTESQAPGIWLEAPVTGGDPPVARILRSPETSTPGSTATSWTLLESPADDTHWRWTRTLATGTRLDAHVPRALDQAGALALLQEAEPLLTP